MDNPSGAALPPSHRSSLWNDCKDLKRPLCGEKDPLKGGDQLIALFRDRYFEILAYLLTVLAEILRPQRKPLCGGKDPLKGGDQLIACFAIAILKSWRIC